jgi:hypothetical protein
LVLAGQAARGPRSVSKTIVPFDTAARALFFRLCTCSDETVSTGGDPAFAERTAPRAFPRLTLLVRFAIDRLALGVGDTRAAA